MKYIVMIMYDGRENGCNHGSVCAQSRLWQYAKLLSSARAIWRMFYATWGT